MISYIKRRSDGNVYWRTICTFWSWNTELAIYDFSVGHGGIGRWRERKEMERECIEKGKWKWIKTKINNFFSARAFTAENLILLANADSCYFFFSHLCRHANFIRNLMWVMSRCQLYSVAAFLSDAFAVNEDNRTFKRLKNWCWGPNTAWLSDFEILASYIFNFRVQWIQISIGGTVALLAFFLMGKSFWNVLFSNKFLELEATFVKFSYLLGLDFYLWKKYLKTYSTKLALHITLFWNDIIHQFSHLKVKTIRSDWNIRFTETVLW